MKRGAAIALLVLCAGCSPAPREPTRGPATTLVTGAGEGDQRFAELGTCALDSGETIRECRIGYRTYGKLDAARSNLVLFPTWFTGTTKTLADIVPGKLVDTKRFFLVLVDALGNGVSSGPSTSRLQPRLRFPKFTVHDMVETQRRLLREVLGVQKAHTVLGVSMGGMQTFEWAVSHPDEVGRIVPIVGTPQLASHDLLLWNAELQILEGSAAYAGGEYSGHPKIPALQAVHWMMLTTPAHRSGETSRQAFPAWFEAKTNDTEFDWNDWHRQAEAMLAHDVARKDGGDLALAAKRVKARALVVVAGTDHMVSPGPALAFGRALGAEIADYDAPCGHMLGTCVDLPSRVRPFMEADAR